MKWKYLILLLALGALCVIGLFNLNKDILLLWGANTIHVTADQPLNKEKVKIEFGISVNTINREKYSVLFDGKDKEEMINDYGENDFLITYNNEYYLSFRQFKLNRRKQHDYYFHFFEKRDSVFVLVDIKGSYALSFERPMIKIAQAHEYRCNGKIDSTKVMYNGVDLNPIRNKD
jgi:hypothetical protein